MITLKVLGKFSTSPAINFRYFTDMWLKYLVLRLRGLGNKERQAVNQVIEITPKEVVARTQKGEKLAFLDVREPYEREASKIDDSTFIPMGEVKNRLSELNKQQP